MIDPKNLENNKSIDVATKASSNAKNKLNCVSWNKIPEAKKYHNEKTTKDNFKKSPESDVIGDVNKQKSNIIPSSHSQTNINQDNKENSTKKKYQSHEKSKAKTNDATTFSIESNSSSIFNSTYNDKKKCIVQFKDNCIIDFPTKIKNEIKYKTPCLTKSGYCNIDKSISSVNINFNVQSLKQRLSKYPSTSHTEWITKNIQKENIKIIKKPQLPSAKIENNCKKILPLFNSTGEWKKQKYNVRILATKCLQNNDHTVDKLVGDITKLLIKSEINVKICKRNIEHLKYTKECPENDENNKTYPMKMEECRKLYLENYENRNKINTCCL